MDFPLLRYVQFLTFFKLLHNDALLRNETLARVARHHALVLIYEIFHLSFLFALKHFHRVLLPIFN